MSFDAQLQVFRARIEEGLKCYIPLDESTPDRLQSAMKHSIFAGGKRVRPILLLAAFDINPSLNDPIPAAVALEALHTYSLIHDDLPDMDDSDLRRGHLTCHKAFDPATAILAGDALLTLSFELLSTAYRGEPRIACDLIKELSYAAGSGRLIGGQMEDVWLDKSQSREAGSLDHLTRIEDNKTGALFEASLMMGLILADRPEDELKIAKKLGVNIGRTFQIIDDILDATSDDQTLGKTTNIDSKNQKLTAVTQYGVDGARDEVDQLVNEGKKLVKSLDQNNEFLMSFLDYLKHRAN
ncbi:MAG: polyprenyl synthetase family protein [Opitutales bacterium]|nr:polyprenyl synthetase family protein [Opitutales bacterium]